MKISEPVSSCSARRAQPFRRRLHIAWGLLWFWVIRGHAIEGLRWYEEILSRPPLPPGVESRVLNGAAVMRYMQERLDRAHQCLACPDTRRVAQQAARICAVHAESILGFVEHVVGNLDAARDCLARSVKGSRAQAIRWATGQTLTGLASSSLLSGDAKEAERLLDEAASVLRDAGSRSVARRVPARCPSPCAAQGTPMKQSLVISRQPDAHPRARRPVCRFPGRAGVLAAAAALKGDDAWVARILGAQDAVTDGTGIVVDSSLAAPPRAGGAG